MNAIKNGKIDDWPSNLVTAYVDSGSNIDPEYEKQIVISHIVESTNKTKGECVKKLQELDFTDEMLNGTIGALSGGWQMKMRLVRAVLQEPDICKFFPERRSSTYIILTYVQFVPWGCCLILPHSHSRLPLPCALSCLYHFSYSFAFLA